MAAQYPLDIRFKLVALAPRMFVTDATGNNVSFVSQKVMALKEDITVYTDDSRSNELYKIKADRIVDFSANYAFTDSKNSKALGAIRSKGWRSIWKATYEIVDATGTLTHRITEDNPWVKIGDSLLGEVPVLGLFTGYFLNPSYTAIDEKSGQPAMRLTKQKAFF